MTVYDLIEILNKDGLDIEEIDLSIVRFAGDIPVEVSSARLEIIDEDCLTLVLEA